MPKAIPATSTLALLLLAGAASAADNGIYFGASVGDSNIEIHEGLAQVDGSDTGFKLIAGFRPLDWLAVEGNYIDMGGDSAEGTSIDSSAISVSALLLAEVGIVDLYARAGMAMWDTEFSSLGDSVSDDGWEPTYGVGVGVHFGSLGVRAEYEYLKAEPFDDFVDGVETKYSTITLSVTYTFL